MDHAVRIVTPSHALFALTLVALGIWTVVAGDFAGVWQPVARDLPYREALRYTCACLSLAGGIGLLWPRTAAIAARSMLQFFALWLMLVKVPAIVRAPAVEVSYESAGETAVIVAGAWVLFAWFAADRGRRWFDAPAGSRGLRLARVLFALALVAFGLSHFVYVRETAALVPHWLPAHTTLAYVTGAAYLAAAVALLAGRLAALAARLAAMQMGLFTLLVWAPVLAAGSAQQDEFVLSWTLAAAAWLVADSYQAAATVPRS